MFSASLPPVSCTTTSTRSPALLDTDRRHTESAGRIALTLRPWTRNSRRVACIRSSEELVLGGGEHEGGERGSIVPGTGELGQGLRPARRFEIREQRAQDELRRSLARCRLAEGPREIDGDP